MNQKRLFIIISFFLLLMSAVILFPFEKPNEVKGISGSWQNYNTVPSYGAGTASNPYLIYTPTQLAFMLSYPSSYYKLMVDVDMSAHYWVPVINFTGQIDGNFKTISGIEINPANSYSYLGFIGSISYSGSGSTIAVKNLRLHNSRFYLNNPAHTSGGVVGLQEGKVIENVKVTDCSIWANKFCGGIVGRLLNGTLRKVYSNSDVYCSGNKNDVYAGGIIGYSFNGTVSEGVSEKNTINARTNIYYSYAGGLTGYNYSVEFTDCLSNSYNIRSYYTNFFDVPISIYYYGLKTYFDTAGYDSHKIKLKQRIETHYSFRAGKLCGYSDNSTQARYTRCIGATPYSNMQGKYGTGVYQIVTNESKEVSNKNNTIWDLLGKDDLNLLPSTWTWYSLSETHWDQLANVFWGDNISWDNSQEISTTPDDNYATTSYGNYYGSYCYSYNFTYLPSTFNNGIWAYDPILNDGYLTQRWLYWQYAV